MAAPKKIKFVPQPGERCIYQLKLTLKWTDPKIWRQILIPNDMLLEDLHYVIQVIMPWDGGHMHQFIQKKAYYQAPQEDFFDGYFEAPIDYTDITVSSLLQLPKDKMDYEYDFGDGWIHNIVLEKVLPWDDQQTLPFCIGGELNAPPEDCGGIGGFYNMLEILQDPQHKEYAEMKEWIGEDYDPNHFDLDEVNEQF